jgi:hypothetical protein
MNEEIARANNGWGYRLLPKAHPHSPGHTGLLATLCAEPTRLHYDPESLRLRLHENGQAIWTTLTLASPLRKTWPVCPGLVSLRDRLGKRVDFFVFGGLLTGQADPDKVVYRLESPAPVLEIVNYSTALPDQFAAEVELMLSKFRPRFGTDDQGFARRLAQVEPFQFYTASLESILLHYQRVHTLYVTYHTLYTALCKEKAWLQANGQWPAQSLTLSKLFEID